jgi:hypothetical protein
VGFVLDESSPAVPIGIRGREMSMELLEPASSAEYLVRGFIEVDSPEAIPAELEGQPVFADPAIAPFVTCGGSPAVGDAAAVAAKLNVAALHGRGLNGGNVAIAIMDTGINVQHVAQKLGRIPRFDAANSWKASGNPTLPFNHPVDHGSMCAFDALIAAPDATLLDYPILSAQAPGGALTGSTLSVALQAFTQLMVTWRVAFAPGGAQRYTGLVVSNSWGIFHPSWDFPIRHPGRYIDNPNHPFNLMVEVLGRTGADVIFAAGNCGADCADGRCQGRTSEAIMGANAIPAVLTVAGCDVNDVRVGYSSQGPSIAGMFQEKPDLTAYTHFLGSEAFGQGSPDTGTSAACPVAAGCVAAIRTKQGPDLLPPTNLFDQLRATSTQPQAQPGWNGDYGHGVIAPDAAAQSIGV